MQADLCKLSTDTVTASQPGFDCRLKLRSLIPNVSLCFHSKWSPYKLITIIQNQIHQKVFPFHYDAWILPKKHLKELQFQDRPFINYSFFLSVTCFVFLFAFLTNCIFLLQKSLWMMCLFIDLCFLVIPHASREPK